MKKGQLTLEFMMMMITAVIFTIVLLATTVHITKQKIQEKHSNELYDLGKSLQSEIIIAAEAHTGYHRRIYVPQTLKAGTYQITNTNYALTLTQSQASFTFDIPNATGTLSHGENIIQNQNGYVIIT